MDGMKQIPDKYFDLAIVDPSYFSGPERREFYGNKISSIGVSRLYKKSTTWIVPTEKYFQELFRVSSNQIIWGCNYYDYKFGPGRIVWDKVNGESSFSDCEEAYCSLHNSSRLFRFMWSGMFQGKSVSDGTTQQGNKKLNEKRIHPTQKPVALYKWILANYTTIGDKILDTHVGSGSSIVACYELGFDYLGYEIDTDYFNAASKRIEAVKAQGRLFVP
jgi:site-specific DNA-methyltransferase (adenine-specific)